MKIVNSARLAFRLMNQQDGEYLYQLDQDPEVMKYINGGKPTTRTELQEIFLPRLKAYTNPDKGWGLWMVTTLGSDQYLGWILARPMYFFDPQLAGQPQNLELGWRFKQACWGQGYAVEAARAVVEGLTQQTQVERFTALADTANSRSIKVMDKLGMQFDKRALHRDPLGDIEVVYYSMPASPSA